MTNDVFRSIRLIKFAVREATAFVAHSFADEDREVVERISQFLSKLGVSCDSGYRAEPRSVSEKVLARLLAAELFVGIFTRRDKKPDETYTTSPWLIEEKAAAIQAGKRLLLFVEEGVEQSIGGLQGDYEYIRFNRVDLADALIRAMDYVLAVTMVPLQCEVNYATNSINMKLGSPNVSLDGEIKKLMHQKQLRPNDPNVIMELSAHLEKNNQRNEAISELQALVRSSPQLAEAHHRLAHFFENAGQLDDALLSYQSALDRNTNDYKYHRCYGRCLYQKAKTIPDATARRSTLEKARRLLQRAAVIGGEKHTKEIEADLFLIQEAMADFDHPNFDDQSPPA
jgi:tetratricopeptide (TPR) repeat protein